MKNTTVVIIAFSFCISSLATDYTIDTISFRSEILDETRQFSVFLPAEFSNTDACEIIYMLDGESMAYRCQQLAAVLPTQTIIIGIFNTDRRRDLLYANEAEKFLEYLAEELIPRVENEYTVKSSTLFGHSFGGSFTLYAMLTRPGLFDSYIASSPTPIMDLIDSKWFTQLDTSLVKNIKFNFSHGTKDKKQVKKWSKRLNKNLQGINLNRINWEYEVFENENHNTSDIVSFKKGLGL